MSKYLIFINLQGTKKTVANNFCLQQSINAYEKCLKRLLTDMNHFFRSSTERLTNFARLSPLSCPLAKSAISISWWRQSLF